MCRPVRSTLALTICVPVAPARFRPRAVPVVLPPPACVMTTASGSLPVTARISFGDLEAERLDAGHAKARVERRGEVAGLVEQLEHVAEQLRTHRQLHDLGAERLADAGLLDDLGLADVPGVERLLAR